MTTLVLEQTVLPTSTTPSTLVIGSSTTNAPLIFTASSNSIHLLSPTDCALLQTIPFELAFRSIQQVDTTTGGTIIDLLAFDTSSGRIAAHAHGKIAVFEPALLGKLQKEKTAWRVHSSFAVGRGEKKVHVMDYAGGRIVLASEEVLSVWEVDEKNALPRWSRLGSERLETPISLAKLSPSGQVLATVTRGSSLVRLSNIFVPTSPSLSPLRFRSNASHSIRLRSISWRPTDDPSDSGPILFTQTIDNLYRIWGCMIDEPEFFSLWCTLDVHSLLSSSSQGGRGTRPLNTVYAKTEEIYQGEEGKKGTKDRFLTVMNDGSLLETVVSNFDCRPPTCLSQQTSSIPNLTFLPTQLSNLRQLFYIPSSSKDEQTSSLLARCSRGSLLHLPLPLPSSSSSSSTTNDHTIIPRIIPTSHLDLIGNLLPSFCGDALLGIPSFRACEEGGGKKGRVQNWEMGQDEVVTDSWVAELGDDEIGEETKVVGWHDGRLLAVFQPSSHLKIFKFSRSRSRMRLLVSLPPPSSSSFSSEVDPLPTESTLLTFHLARTAEEALSTTLIGTWLLPPSGEVEVRTWTFTSSRTHPSLSPLPTIQRLTTSSSSAATNEAVLVLPVPARMGYSEVTSLLVIDEEGGLRFWEVELLGGSGRGWKEVGKKGVRTGRKLEDGEALAGVSGERMTAMVTKLQDGVGEGWELTIWDDKSSEFASGLQHSQLLSDKPLSISWSHSSDTLAICYPSSVSLLCEQRIDDLSGRPSWLNYATVEVSSLTSSPLTSLAWLSTGLALSSSTSLFFFSSELTTTTTTTTLSTFSSQVKLQAHTFARSASAPLPSHHPQLLFQALLHGHTSLVLRILSSLASQIDEDGDVTPVKNSASYERVVDVGDWLKSDRFGEGSGGGKGSETPNGVGGSKDILKALTAAAARDRESTSSRTLTEEAVTRLLTALKKRPLPLVGLDEREHEHLGVVVRTAFEIQRQRASLDSNGQRYLISMRSFFIYNSLSNTSPSSTTATNTNSHILTPLRSSVPPPPPPVASPRLKYRDMVWAFHSESQDLLLEESLKACELDGKLTWDNAKALGVFMWIRSYDTLVKHIELVGRTSFLPPRLSPSSLSDERDPITSSLFYIALRKKHIVLTFWKQSGGHSDQKSMLKFLANDFELQRWKSAALKNAYALMSKRRFLFAAAFFLLGDSLKDCINVLLRNLNDFQLAIAIARVYEGSGDEVGPVLKMILEETVLPLAFREGFRWLASWAFWMLKRRDLAIQTIVTPLADLATRLPYKLESIGSPPHEDPCLVLLFEQLRSKSLQTVKGAYAVPGRTEFNFVLHMSRVLCRMGCHVLALSLLRSYEFIPSHIPTPPPSSPHTQSILPSSPPPFRRTLRRQSTVLDMELPSNLNSRAPSPVRGAAPGGSEFHNLQKKVRVETKAPAEFSFDSFNF